MGGEGQTGDPGERRPARRLETAPAERYRPAPAPGADDGPDTAGRRIGAAVGVAAAGAVAIALAGGLLTMTAGLVVVAAVIGWATAAVIGSPRSGEPGRARRRALAAVIALGGVALGQLGLWLIARGEGGTLAPLAYLAEVFGALVPAQLLVASGLAWLRTR